jgi:Zn-dependent protease with chaperone function
MQIEFDRLEFAIVVVGALCLSAVIFARFVQWNSRLRDLGVKKGVLPGVSNIWDAAWILFVIAAMQPGSPDSLVYGMSSLAKVSILLFLLASFGLAWIRERHQMEQLEVYEVLRGALKSKIEALAAKAGDHSDNTKDEAKRFRVYVVPDGFRAWTATQRGHNILLPTQLIECMDRREIDALVARHLTRQQRQYYFEMILPAVVFSLGAACLLEWLSLGSRARWAALLLLVVVEIVGLAVYSQRTLFQADLRAIQVTSDPESFISLLVKLSKANSVDLNVSVLQKLARRTGVDPRRLRRLIEDESRSPIDPYPTSSDFATKL